MAKRKVLSKKHRIQLDFSADAYKRFCEIRELGDIENNAELIRRSLRLYDWYLTRVKLEGSKLQIVKDDTITTIEFDV
jgi:hypothetical protein